MGKRDSWTCRLGGGGGGGGGRGGRWGMGAVAHGLCRVSLDGSTVPPRPTPLVHADHCYPVAATHIISSHSTSSHLLSPPPTHLSPGRSVTRSLPSNEQHPSPHLISSSLIPLHPLSYPLLTCPPAAASPCPSHRTSSRPPPWHQMAPPPSAGCGRGTPRGGTTASGGRWA